MFLFFSLVSSGGFNIRKCYRVCLKTWLGNIAKSQTTTPITKRWKKYDVFHLGRLVMLDILYCYYYWRAFRWTLFSQDLIQGDIRMGAIWIFFHLLCRSLSIHFFDMYRDILSTIKKTCVCLLFFTLIDHVSAIFWRFLTWDCHYEKGTIDMMSITSTNSLNVNAIFCQFLRFITFTVAVIDDCHSKHSRSQCKSTSNSMQNSKNSSSDLPGHALRK